MELSPGLIGALVGLGIGLVEYRVVAGMVVGGLRRTDRSATPEERDAYERRIGWTRAVLAVVMIGVTPLLGYLIGRTAFG